MSLLKPGRFDLKKKLYTLEICLTSNNNNNNTLSKMKTCFSKNGAISNLY